MRILLRIPTAKILWDFDFLRGLAPGRLDGFSSTKRSVTVSTLMLRSLKAEQCDFRGKNRSSAGTLSKQGFHPFSSIIVTVNGELKIAQKTSFEAKGRLYTTGKVIQRLFIIDLHT